MVDRSEIDTRETVDARQLMDLFATTWWAADRTAADVSLMLSASAVTVGLVHRPADRLVGFARALSDGVYLAVILDVVVAPDLRGSGLGALLLDTVVRHPALSRVRSIELVCQPELVPFYRRWGFTDRVGRSTLMRRTTDPLLIDG